MAIYAKIDDVSNLSPTELVDEIYKDDPEIIFRVILDNRRPPDSATNTEAFAALVKLRSLEADDVVDGFLLAEEQRAAERGSTLRALASSVVEAARDLEAAHEREATVKHLAALLASLQNT